MVSGEYPPMKGGVSRYTYSLVKALAKKVEVCVATNEDVSNIPEEHDDHTDYDSSNNNNDNNNLTTYPIIRKGDRGNSDRLLKLVSQFKPDVVNVQYERGLYEIDTPLHIIRGILYGSTLDKFYKACPIPTISTIHTVYPYSEYRAYVRQRAARKVGKISFLPLPVRIAIRSQMMEQRYRLILRVVQLSREVISPAKTVQSIVKRGTIIYHGAERAVAINLPYEKNKIEFRKEFGLPTNKMLLLAFGYAGFYKGFDILDGLSLPKDWKIVIKQDRHERGNEKPIQIRNAINLNLGYLDDKVLSKLFSACDAIIFPYRLVSVSGVLFDALAHGLPFIGSDLGFFKEFAGMGLGVVCKRDAESFSKSIQYLDENYSQYRKRVEQFGPTLRWSNIADRHIEVYSRSISSYVGARSQ